MQKLVMIVLLVALALGGSAQIRRTVKPKPVADSTAAAPAESPQMGRKALLQELNLSKEQKRKLRELMAKEKGRKQAIEADTLLTDQEKKQRLRAMRKQQFDGVEAILTPEQRTQWRQMMKEAVKQKRAGKQAGTAAGEMEMDDLDRP
jgi:Spy/CpxP family protein refolding chaperone